MFKFENDRALPCPFCGSDDIWAEEYEHGTSTGARWRIFCGGCMAGVDRGTDVTPHTVLDIWNKRVESAKAGMTKRQEDYLKNAFDTAVYNYNSECEKNGGREGSVMCYRHLVEMQTLQKILFDLCGLSYGIKRHF